MAYAFQECDVGRSGKVKVTILASEWGSSKGGLSTINRNLAIQLAKSSDVEISFFVPQCSEKDKTEALSYKIRIIEATKMVGFEGLDLLSHPPDDLQIEVVIGHGVKLGCQAQIIRRYRQCKWVQVVHTNPEEMGMFKSYANPILKGEEKHNEEVKLCEMADFVVGIGPKLAEAFCSYLRPLKNDQTIFDFTPGIFEEFLSVKQVTKERKHRRVLVFGRGDVEDFMVKGYDIAAKAVASLPDTHLVFVGAPDGKHDEIAESFMQCGLPANRLRVRGYENSRESLKCLFCEVDLMLMPSRTEGFGLTGLEALSAGLPILVSKNSGFGEALLKVKYGSSYVIDSENYKKWARAIKKILWMKDRHTRLEEAKGIRKSYQEKYSWTKQRKALLVNIIDLVRARLRLQIGVASCTEDRPRTCTRPKVHPWELQEAIQDIRVPSTSGSLASENCENESNQSAQTVLHKIADKCNQHISTLELEHMNGFLCYLEMVHKVSVISCKARSGSLIVAVEVGSGQVFEELRRDYRRGRLNQMAQEFLVTEELLEEFGLIEFELATLIAEEEFQACQNYFLRNPVSMASAPHTSQFSRYGKVRITILAYEWRSSQNEVSTLIRELAIQWAKSPNVEITLLMLQCSEEDKKESLSHGIKITKGEKPYRLQPVNSGKMNFFFYPPRDLQIDLVVSFGLEFGYLAQAMKRFLKCAWVQVVLMDRAELGVFQYHTSKGLEENLEYLALGGQEEDLRGRRNLPPEGAFEFPRKRDLEYHASRGREGGLRGKRTISREEESKYHTAQGQKAFNIHESANFVVGVGRKLAKDLSERKRIPEVFEFTPGLFHFRIVPQHSEERKQRKVLVFGRGDADVSQLEGLDIAGKAVASLVDTHLVFVKEEGAKHEEVLKRFINCDLPSERLSVECFNHSGEHLEWLFSQVDLMLIPWRSNGFALTGLKALSACLPVLVSKKSGFGEALYKIKRGSLFVIDSEDPEEWAARIKKMWDKPRRTLLREVEDLRMLYEQMNSWQKQSQDLLEEMIKLVPDKACHQAEDRPTARLPLRVNWDAKPRPRKRRSAWMRDTQEPQEIHQEGEPSPSTSEYKQRRADESGLAAEYEGNQNSQDVLKGISGFFIQEIDPSNPKEVNGFVDYLQNKRKVLIIAVETGSLIITVEASSQQILQDLWADYCTGHLNNMAQKYLVTDELLKRFDLVEVKIETVIREEDYRACLNLFTGSPAPPPRPPRPPEFPEDELRRLVRWVLGL